MNEFIKKLIERLEEQIFSAELHDFGWEGQTVHNLLCLGDVEDIVDQLAEEYINCSTDTSTDCSTGWIPCSERLPIGEEYRKQIDGSYYYKHMLTTTNEIDIPICVGWYDQENEVWCDLEGFAFYPIAWQSLPEPYQPEGEFELYKAKSVDGEYQEYKGDWK